MACLAKNGAPVEAEVRLNCFESSLLEWIAYLEKSKCAKLFTICNNLKVFAVSLLEKLDQNIKFFRADWLIETVLLV